MELERIRITPRDLMYAELFKKRKGRVRARCKLCRSEQGKRLCKAIKAVICPECCRKMRGKIEGCDESCFYYAPLIRRSRFLPSEEELPIYTCLMTDTLNQGMVTAVIARKKPDGNLQAMFILLDLWKRGIRDCFMDADLTEEDLKEQVERGGEVPFKEISYEEFLKLVRWGYEIAKQVKAPIPEELKIWGRKMIGDLSKVPPPEGSLYKCAKCGGDLPEEAVELMKQYALQDDIQFYILCRKCGGQFED